MKLAGSDKSIRYNRFGRSRRRRPLWRRLLAPLLLLAVATGASVWGVGLLDSSKQPQDAMPRQSTAPAPTERTAALPALNLPADDAPHGSAMEWWYYSGLLDGPAGQRWAFHVAVFVANNLIKHTVMHAALTDLATGRRHLAQRRTAGLPARADAGFDFRDAGWSLRGHGAAHRFSLDDVDGASLSLDLQDSQPVVAHRASGSLTPGLLDFGDAGISYYYSRPRMTARGTVRTAGAQQAVTGTVWFDHQWGAFDVSRLGWNWFALHFSDGSDLMVYQLFDRQGLPVTTTGTLVQPGGTSRPLAPNEVSMAPIQRWVSRQSRIEYPVGWRLQLPWGEAVISPMREDSEFDAGASSANIYWEGPVTVRGARTGEGFMELSGYAPQAARR